MITPKDTKENKKMNLFAQRYPAFVTRYDPRCISILFLSLAILFLAGGIAISCSNLNLYESSIIYDGEGSLNSECHIQNKNEHKICNVTFTVDIDVQGPLYIYYELTNFHQNHRQYVESRCDDQLLGRDVPLHKQERDCKYKIYNENNTKILNPCGLIANSLFNDIYILNHDHLFISERDISREVDRKLYHNPENYGHDSTYQWIYETYPNIHKEQSLNPHSSAYYGGGVEDEHFVVWMSIDAFPSFRKMYGKILSSVPKGTTLTFSIENNFEVESFHGTKTLVLSTQNIYSSFTPSMAIINYVLAAFCLIIAIYFAVVYYLYPQYLSTPMVKRD